LVRIVETPQHGDFVIEGDSAYGCRSRYGYLGTDAVEYAVRRTDGRLTTTILTIKVRSLAETLSATSAGDEADGIAAAFLGL
jgi:hypothetical protein